MDVREWYEDLNPGARKAFIGGCILALLILVSAVTSCFNEAEAVEPGWYAPLDGSGQGVIVRCSDECAVNWVTHSPAGQVWLISNEPCARGEPCDTSLSRVDGSWMGIDGDAERLPAEVFVTLTPGDDGLRVEWDAIDLLPACNRGDGSGGLLLEQCVGNKTFFLLAE